MNELIQMMVMSMLLRMCYEVSRADNNSMSNLASVQQEKKCSSHDKLTIASDVRITKGETELLPQFRRLARKSVERYALAQERKWHNWVKGMSR